MYRIILPFLLLLASCDLQGPWEYYPQDYEMYKGLFVTGFIIADKPVEDICIEKLNELNEVTEPSVKFYQSISGVVHSGTDTMRLAPRSDLPNCLKDTVGIIPERGKAYTLELEVIWDSMGTVVTSRPSSVTNIPTDFSISDTAKYELPELPPEPKDSTGYLPFLFAVDSEILDSLAPRYLPAMVLLIDPVALETLSVEDTANFSLDNLPVERYVLDSFITANWDSIYADIVYYDSKMSKVDYYMENDTVKYLYDSRNLSNHKFATDFSDDVQVVLTTHVFSDSALFPETAFSGLFGTSITAKEFFFKGNQRRLLTQDNQASFSEEGSNFLDEITVVNSWFYGGENTLYFYAFDEDYQKYVNSTIFDGDNAMTEPYYNITNGRGIFAGAVADSFDLYVEVDTNRIYFTRNETYDSYCNDGNWGSKFECREFFIEYCETNYFLNDLCLQLIVENNYRAGREWNVEAEIDSIWISAKNNADVEMKTTDSTSREFKVAEGQFKAASDKLAVENPLDNWKDAGRYRYCIYDNYPTTVCDTVKTEFFENDNYAENEQILITFCSDRSWDSETYPQCGDAIVLNLLKLESEGNTSRDFTLAAREYCDTQTNNLLCAKKGF